MCSWNLHDISIPALHYGIVLGMTYPQRQKLFIIEASFSHLAASNFSALWFLAVLTIPYLEGAEVISRGTLYVKKLIFQAE